jgi:hypothetical protein
MDGGPVAGVFLFLVHECPSDRVAFHGVVLHVFDPFAAPESGRRNEFCSQGISIGFGYKQAQVA